MITKSHRRLMEEVRKAYEHQCGVAEAWMRSGRPQDLLARVHDEIEAGERDRDSRERPRLPRIAWAAFGFAMIAVVVVVAALVASGTSPSRPVASVATIAPIAGETEYLTKKTVIEEIAALFEDYPGVVQGDPA